MTKPSEALGSKLLGAVAAGMEPRARELLREGADPNWRAGPASPRTPFLMALDKGLTALAVDMLPRADVWSRDVWANLPWLLACKARDARAMRAFCEAMRDSEQAERNQAWPRARLTHDKEVDVNAVHLALDGGAVDCLRVALEFGAETSAKNADGMSALASACYKGASESVVALLDYGAGSNPEEAWEAAQKACLSDHDAGLAALLSARPILMEMTADAAARLPLIHTAAGFGGIRCIEMLLDAGCDPNQRNAEGNTALIVAAGDAHLEAVELLAGRADLWARNKHGRTALSMAAASNSEECAAFLAEKMAEGAPDQASYLAELCCALGEARGQGSAEAAAELRPRAESAREAVALRLSALEGLGPERRGPRPKGSL